MTLNRREFDLILMSLQNEKRDLGMMLNDLERRNLHVGDQSVKIQMRMAEIDALYLKVQAEALSV